MKLAKDLMFMGLGATAVLTYQKYSKPLMNKMGKSINKVVKNMENKLDNME